nr:putative ribonuclease h protein [Quercus suber]
MGTALWLFGKRIVGSIVEWDTNLIDLCFYPPDALLIKSLPLCSSPQPDTLVWRSERSGCYSVKLGYKLLCEPLLPDTNRPPVVDSKRGLWKSIWQLNVPSKIKHFLWKACTNSLPSKENLLKRKILLEFSCPRCSGVSESVVHALWSCTCIEVVWQTDFDWVDRSSSSIESFSDVLQRILTKHALLPLFATTAWSVWYQRNKSRHLDNPLPLQNIAGFAKNYLHEFRSLVCPHPHKRHAVSRRWVPPAAGVVKEDSGGSRRSGGFQFK